jgi:DNA-binding response OmpR family regulator
MSRDRVFVVDDDPAVVKAVRAVLSPEGFEVDGATDSTQALSAILREAPDVLILDINMPVLNGWELCDIVRRQSQTRDVPILFLTGRTELRDQITAMQVGGTDHLRKPFRAEELRERVRALAVRAPKRAR